MKVVQTNFRYNAPLIPLDLGKVKYIVIHHPDIATAAPEQIHQWHLDNGWSGFGYNEYIRKDGTVYIGRGDNIGAQCQNYNSKSYGICCEGNYDVEQNVPQALLNSLAQRINYNRARFKNFIEVVPHSKLNATSCPGKYFPKNLNNLVGSQENPLKNSLNILKNNGVINSPDYWIENAVNGKTVKGEYAAELIKKMAQKFGNG